MRSGIIAPMKRVLVVSTVKGIAGRSCLDGIFDYVNSGRDWSIQFLQDPDDIPPSILRAAVKEGVDGIVVTYSRRTRSLAELMRTRVPIVQVHDPDGNSAGLRRNFTLLQNDEIQVGEVAAEYLRTRGSFRSYAYLPTDEPTTWSDRHRLGFAAALKRHGASVASPAPGESKAAFLSSLPRPAAVFCATDPVAMNAIALCRKLKLRIPSQIAVLGVDDDELLCESSRPSLSSVHTDDFGLGRLAAVELDRLMRTRVPAEPSVKCVPPTGVTERDSTRAVPPAGHLIRRALSHIRANPADGVSATAHALGVSAPLLRLRFREIHGRSLRDEIISARIALATKLLQKTNEPIARISAKSGFSSPNWFAHIFRDKTGHTPAEVRRAAHAAPT